MCKYSSIGTYTITVIALSGGEETTTYTEEIEIVDPLVLPITFESETVDYTFYNVLEDRHRNRINILLGKAHDPKGIGYFTNAIISFFRKLYVH